MKKQLNTSGIANELKGSSLFFGRSSEVAPRPMQGIQPRPGAVAGLANGSDNGHPRASLPGNESRGKPIDQSTSRSIDQSTILGRPKAFYITEKQDKDLDLAVTRLSELVRARVNLRIDRSTVMRLLLEMNDLTTKSTIDKLGHQLISRLVSQLTG